MMCLYAAATIKLQCNRGYSFSDEEKLRARDLSSLTAEELNDLSTNVITSECNLSRFDREARVGKVEIGDSKKNTFATTWCYTKMKLI